MSYALNYIISNCPHCPLCLFLYSESYEKTEGTYDSSFCHYIIYKWKNIYTLIIHSAI